MSGLVLGIAVGAAARWAQFCTLGAIADSVLVGDRQRLRAWMLAIAVAILGTQTLYLGGIVDLAQSPYLDNGFGWFGALLGGGMFGLGMALVGTCGFGTLIRLAGGDLRALIDLATIGIFAYLTISGPLAHVRITVAAWTDIPSSTLPLSGIPELLARVFGYDIDGMRLIVTLVFAGTLIAFSFRHRPFWRRYKDITSAVIIGLAVCCAWGATGYLGHDAFDPKPPAALTFVRPLGDSILFAMLSSGMSLNFGIATVAGVLVGAHVIVHKKKEWRLEGFDGDKEMIRHLTGSALMGVGGVLALGCTIGQGISGMSTLALSAPLTFAAIFVGATLGLRYLEEGHLVAAVKVILRPF